MPQDLLCFLRHLASTIHFIRHIIAAFLLLLLLCAIAVTFAEGLSFARAVYFVLITALTIGYGDITPTSTWGQIVSVVAGVIGVLGTGIVIAVTVRALSDAFKELEEQKVDK